MQGELDTTVFFLAEETNQTVERLLSGEARPLSNREYLMWRAFWNWRDAMRKLAAKEAK